MNELTFKISNFFFTMQAGPQGLDMLATMFAEDTTYTEPFSGQREPHKGRRAIVAASATSRPDAFNDGQSRWLAFRCNRELRDDREDGHLGSRFSYGKA
ncbi:hypothetical protein [uncultured Ruegeria sp.]|uniref:hypothetical protein n=1 Tax=uncultured Ruegeria sp. TaxID=259304 RepID=UPI002616E5B6|nr:hypothetical protein [uncultured Ruegeria sp.]